MVKPPIIIYSWGDVEVIETVEEAEKGLEPVDVEKGEYLLFDSEGRILEAVVVNWNKVNIQEATVETRFTPQLRHMLTWFLRRVAATLPIGPDATLAELIGAMRAHSR